MCHWHGPSKIAFALMLAFMLCFPLLLLLRFPTDSALTSQQVHLSE